MRRTSVGGTALAGMLVALPAALLRSVTSMPRRIARAVTLAALVVFATLAALLPVTAGAVGAGDKIYWGDLSADTIRGANLDGSGTASTLIGGGGGPCGVAIDAADGKIYWANFSSNGIRVANLDGSGTASTLFGGEGSLCGVAIDPAAGKIYWANRTLNEIRVANLDGIGVAVTLFAEPSGSEPSGVAIDPAGDKIYWTNQSADEVRVANLDGSDTPSTLFGPVQAADTPIGVAVDLAAGKVFWSAFASGEIRVANLDGTGTVSVLFSGESGPIGVAIDRSDGKIYWANYFSGAIRVGNLDGTGAATLSGFEGNPLFPALLRAPAAGAVAPAASRIGKQLTCTTGSWAPDLVGAFLFRAPQSFAYQWQRDGTDIPDATASSFTLSEPGSYTCRVTAANHAGSTSQTSSALGVALLDVVKFYDSNTNGELDGAEGTISFWKVQVGSSSYLTPQSLAVGPASYQVGESDPVQTNWRHTNAGSVQVSAVAGDQATVMFGNVCLGAGGGLGTGFWTNKNGQALFGTDDLAWMVSRNLRNADGTLFDPISYSLFKSWLGKATGTNMAYDLSAQLAAMELNVLNGKVGGGSLIYAPGTTSANAAGFATVNAVMTEANTELGLHGLVKGGNPFRAYQTALRDALYKANGNSTFAQATPCAFRFS